MCVCVCVVCVCVHVCGLLYRPIYLCVYESMVVRVDVTSGNKCSTSYIFVTLYRTCVLLYYVCML